MYLLYVEHRLDGVTTVGLEELKERMPDLRERLPEVRERIDTWRESLPETQTTEAAAGAALLGAGTLTAAFNLFAGRRSAWAWALPAILLTGGAALLVAAVLEQRKGRIMRAEEVVRTELDRLDPIARAQVLKEIAEDELARFSRQPSGAEA